MTPEQLIEAAWQVRENAYAPYSKFKVGAAILSGGQVFTGCNVENLSFGLTICAERVAASSMVAAGQGRIEMVAVVADTGTPVSPCGACRQFLAEFGDPVVYLANRQATLLFLLSDLLPRSSAGILDLPDVPRGT
jgi:cytidine deaminase